MSVYLFQSSSTGEELIPAPIDVGGVDHTTATASSVKSQSESVIIPDDPIKPSESLKSDVFTHEDSKPDNVDTSEKVNAVEKESEDEGEGEGEVEGQSESTPAEVEAKNESDKIDDKAATSSVEKLDKCSFRKYKPKRYYPVNDTSESFLSDSEYIRGKLPFIINPRSDKEVDVNANESMPKKVCIDTSGWESVDADHRPFSDGQNPSFVSLAHDAYSLHDDHHTPRIERSTIKPLQEIYGSDEIDNMFLGLLLFGDSQCRWNMSEEELEEYHFSPLQAAPQKRSMVLILNGSMEPVGEAVLELELDKTWGEKRKRHNKKKKEDGEGYERTIVELDDARLFFHNGKLHVLYRNGPSFGYDSKYAYAFSSKQIIKYQNINVMWRHYSYLTDKLEFLLNYFRTITESYPHHESGRG